MQAPDYLQLIPFRMRAPEEWTPPGKGLTFLFPTAGAGQYTSEQAKLPLRPGNVLIFDHARHGKVTCKPGSALSGCGFSLLLEHLYPLFRAGEISLLPALQARFQKGRVFAASSPLASALHRLVSEAPPEAAIDQRGQLLRIVSITLAEEFKDLRVERGGFVGVEQHLLNVFEQLSMEDIVSLSVGELARRFSVSRRHLNRLFHRFFGFSVVGLKMEMRLLKAVSLLRDEDEKVISVAEQAGFNHLGLFNTCFKRRFGVSPGRWRKTNSWRVPATVNQALSACSIARLGLCPAAASCNGSVCPQPADWPGQVRKAAPAPLVANQGIAFGQPFPEKERPWLTQTR